MKNTLKLTTAVVLLTTSLTGCMTVRHIPVPQGQTGVGAEANELPTPLQASVANMNVRRAGTLGALAQSRKIPGNDDLTYRFRRALARHLDHWVEKQELDAPVLRAGMEYDLSQSGSTLRQGLTGALTLGLVPIIEDGVFTTTVSVTSGGREVYRHQVNETIRAYISIFFPTPLLAGNDGEEAWEKAVNAAMSRHYARLAPWVVAEQEKYRKEIASAGTREQREWLKQNPDSLFRGALLQRLASEAPKSNALAWHSQNLAAFDDYEPLIPPQYAVWFVGPSGHRVIDLKEALEQGEPADILAARIRARRAPYRAFDSAETAVLRKGGIPPSVVAAMIEVSAAPASPHVDSPVSTAPPADVASLAIQGNAGPYLCPWTRSGHLAPWMSKALSNSDMGAAAGKALGSYAGAKAMENVPFVGRMLGEKLGEASGRSIALQAIGGETYMRETSDLSFQTLQDIGTVPPGHLRHFGAIPGGRGGSRRNLSRSPGGRGRRHVLKLSSTRTQPQAHTLA